ncbi:MAG: adenylyl-sulfate kinase, partial [Burkholderiales bacterium]|nr:adenylyl-sulfate kinase [Burkholderiales bacterium]
MVSGAASADAVVLVVDAYEGVQDQTRRHAYLLRLLGIPRVVVAVNKMDLAGYAKERFLEVRNEVAAYLKSIGIAEESVFVPVAAREGANLKIRSAEMPWYDGPTLLEALDALPQPVPAADLPLRLWVQDVYKFDERRIVAGRIESGRLRVGDTVLFSPSNASARVASIESWNTPAPAEAQAGCSVGFTLD